MKLNPLKAIVHDELDAIKSITTEQEWIADRCKMEAALFSAESSLHLKDLRQAFPTKPVKYLQALVYCLIQDYQSRTSCFEILAFSESEFIFQVKSNVISHPALSPYLEKETLSKRQLEVLSLVAYFQPVTKERMKELCRNNPARTLKSLVDLGFVDAQKEGYSITNKFCVYFNIENSSEAIENLILSAI